LIAAALLAFFNWTARQSGQMANKFNMLRRDEYPRIFLGGLIMRWILVTLMVVGAVAAALGYLPLNTN
jgi:hypothetical protein